MNCRFMWITTVFAILIKVIANNGDRLKRGNEDVFNVLLNLYKMQPLKSSKVYRIFTDKILLPYRTEEIAGNTCSNESAKNSESRLQPKLSIRDIEQLIQTNNTNFSGKINSPNYDVENVGSEKFNVDIIFNNAIKLEQEKVHPTIEKPVKIEEDNNFSAILEHIESGESHTEARIDTIHYKTTPDDTINEVAPALPKTQLENNFITRNGNANPINGMNEYDNPDVIVI